MCRINAFLKQFLIVREIAVQFSRFRRVASTQSIPSDEILSQLEKKLEKDADLLGPNKYIVEDISIYTKEIIESEQQINNAITYLKERQNDIANYLINFNRHKSENHDVFNMFNNNNADFLNTE